MITTTTNAVTVPANIMPCRDEWNWLCTILLFMPLSPGLIAIAILAYCEVFIK